MIKAKSRSESSQGDRHQVRSMELSCMDVCGIIIVALFVSQHKHAIDKETTSAIHANI